MTALNLSWLRTSQKYALGQTCQLDLALPFIKKSNLAFVTFASGGYLKLLDKWKSSIEKYSSESDMFIFTDFSQLGCPSHEEVPYAFKPYAIERIKSMGYDIVIWCDSCIRLVKDIKMLIPEIKSRGVFLQNDPNHTIGDWANDRSLQYLNVTRDDAMKLPAIYACIMAFDFTQEISLEFLHRWKKSADDGIFQGKWNNEQKTESQDVRCKGHRHDQTCAELISYQLNIPRGYFVLFPNDTNHPDRYFTSWDNT
jgi:hypothetical protein